MSDFSTSADQTDGSTVQPARYPPDPVDWEQDAATLASIGSELDRVEDALRRLDTPSAGRCDVCGEEIARSVLAADPLRTRCETHSASGPAA